jgi:hypothetical protein
MDTMADSLLQPSFPGHRTLFGRVAGQAGRTRASTGAAAPLRRAGLLVGAAAAIGVAAWVGDPAATLQADPALGHLLRGMALIKALLTMAALAAVYWRFGWTVSRAATALYLLSASTLAGSTMLIWQLSFILPAALLFHAAAISLVVIGWRER